MLQDAQVVPEENAKLRTESSAGTLCQKLAKEAFFGKDIMKKCTPNGTREFPPLPRAELYEKRRSESSVSCSRRKPSHTRTAPLNY